MRVETVRELAAQQGGLLVKEEIIKPNLMRFFPLFFLRMMDSGSGSEKMSV